MINGIVEAWENHEGILAVLAVIGFIIGFVGVVFGLWCFQAWLVMLLWNWVAVSLFGAPVLTFWLSFGLVWLCHLLFKSNVRVKKES